MPKKTLLIEGFDPIDILGINNRNLEAFCSYFPSADVISRGNQIIIDASEQVISDFEKKFGELLQKRMHKSFITPYDVEDLFDRSEVKEIFETDGNSVILYSNEGKPIKARNRNQAEMVKAYFDNDLIFALGPAGTGKTYVAIALAVRALKNREIKKIILTRPAVEAGERLGFLPGDLKEKLDPYLQPLYDALEDMIPTKKLQGFIADGTIQIAPLAYMRGRTLDRACVILDEAQNTNLSQLKMFLTRMGGEAKFIVTGDATQVDLPHQEDSGLLKGVKLVENLNGVKVIRFGSGDIVRHPLVTKIVKAFDAYEAKKTQKDDTAKKTPAKAEKPAKKQVE
ncbi:MAG: PhoH family protein [Bacteroidales bacterium]|nr:PhoH family protein [Bacteroidales bacterium]